MGRSLNKTNWAYASVNTGMCMQLDMRLLQGPQSLAYCVSFSVYMSELHSLSLTF